MNKRMLTGQILLNVGTVLTVALMLFAYRAWAAPVTEVAPAAVVATSAPTVITATTMLPDGVTVNSVMPGAISYQATLTDANGKPLSGNLNMTFGLYATPTGSTALWTETRSGANAVPVDAGLFNVMLGSLTPIPSDVWSNDILYLGVQVGNDAEMMPREKLAAVPYAMVAGTALSVSALDAPDGDPQDALFVDDEGNVGIGTTTPSNLLHVNGGIDIGVARNANSSRQGLNTQKSYATNFQLAATTWGGAHGILFNAYQKSSGVDGDLFAMGNTAYANDVGSYGGRAGAIGFIGNGGNMGFYISPASTGADTDIDWGTPKMSIARSGNVTVNGDFSATGSKSAVVETDHYGQRKLYAFEQATNRFADEGMAQLADGAAWVELDPIFLETIADDFLIHLTPYGNASLYIAEIGADYFVVKSQEEHADVDFAWMLTATRSGYESVRLEEVQMP